MVWTQVFGTFSHPLNISWMSLTCDDSEERALAMALVIMGANIAGIYGAQIFREDDKPKYRRAFSVACAVLAFGIALAIFRFLDDFRRRRREARRVSDTPTSERDESPQKWQTVHSTTTACGTQSTVTEVATPDAITSTIYAAATGELTNSTEQAIITTYPNATQTCAAITTV